MKYDILLWDVDDTLLDFGLSETYAIKHCFSLINYDISEEWINRYSEISKGYWKRLEMGEISKSRVLSGRFSDLFYEMGIDMPDDKRLQFQLTYQRTLGEVYFYRDYSYELCKKLKKSCRQYFVTNGIESTQRNKLKLSGLDAFADGIFVSEAIGYVKPQKEFFETCFKQIEDLDKSKVLLIGDSLTSDIKGAKNAGIDCCWYNPHNGLAGESAPDYIISNLWDVINIIE